MQITATLTFAAACASSGITVLIGNDLNICSQNHCTSFETATAMAFISWFAVCPSFLMNFWSLACRWKARMAAPNCQFLVCPWRFLFLPHLSTVKLPLLSICIVWIPGCDCARYQMKCTTLVASILYICCSLDIDLIVSVIQPLFFKWFPGLLLLVLRTMNHI